MTKIKEIYINGTEAGIANRFKAQVIERRPDHPDCGKVVFESEWAPNLILESGMTAVASNLIANLFVNACVGTGSTPTRVASSPITGTTSSTTLTASSSIFSSGTVGQLIYFPSTGQSATVTAYTNGTTVTLNATLAIGSGIVFEIFAINQTGLGAEVHRTNNYLTGSGNCGTTYSAGVYTHTRTYDFPIETSNQSYSEVGFSISAIVGANLNMRGIFASAPISVVIGQQIRVIYNVLVTVTPVTARARSVVINGWPALPYSVAVSASTNLITLAGYGFPLNTQISFEGTTAPTGITFGATYYVIPNDANTFYISTTPSGSHVAISSTGTAVVLYTNTNGSEQLIGHQFSGVDVNGNTISYSVPASGGAVGEPSTAKSMVLSTDGTALPSFPSSKLSPAGPAGNVISLSAASYSAGTYTLTWNGVYNVDQGNSSAILSLGTLDPVGLYVGLEYLFSEPQQKTSLYALSITWQYTWARILT